MAVRRRALLVVLLIALSGGLAYHFVTRDQDADRAGLAAPEPAPVAEAGVTAPDPAPATPEARQPESGAPEASDPVPDLANVASPLSVPDRPAPAATVTADLEPATAAVATASGRADAVAEGRVEGQPGGPGEAARGPGHETPSAPHVGTDGGRPPVARPEAAPAEVAAPAADQGPPAGPSDQPPAPARAPAEQDAGPVPAPTPAGDEPRDRTGGLADLAALMEAVLGTGADRSPVPSGEAGPDPDAGAGRDGHAAVSAPDERAEAPGGFWSDFGITHLRRSIARLFGGADEADALAEDPAPADPPAPDQDDPRSRTVAAGAPAARDAAAGDEAGPTQERLTSKSEATIRQALRAMVARDEPPEPAAGPGDEATGEGDEVIAALPPTFDIVRVEADGSAVIAGRARPGAQVEVLAGDEVIDQVTADRRGSWVSVPGAPLPRGDQTLSIKAESEDGTVLRSDDVVVIAARAEPPPPQPPREVLGEAPPPQPAEVAAAGEATEPLAVLLPGEGRGAGRILQAPGRISGDGALALMVLDYDLAGQVRLDGEAPPGAPIRIYVDNELAAEVVAAADGTWTSVLEDRLGAGTYTLRIDQLGADGRPVARLETPFTRVGRPPRDGDVDVDYVIVQPGNSLWRIARRLTGRGMSYVHIYDANRGQIRDPDLIYPGQVFEVPGSLGSTG